MLWFFLSLVSTAAASQWSSRAPMPRMRSQHAFVASCGELFAIGGLPDANAQHPLATTDRYNVTTNTWSSGPNMSFPRFAVAVASTPSNIFVFGGYLDALDFNITAITESFDCKTFRWSVGPPLPVALAGASAVALPATSLLGSGIVIAGGFVSDNICSTRVWRFDGTTYHVLPALKFAHARASLVLVQQALYYFAGAGEDSPALNTVETCDLQKGCHWVEASDTNRARDLFAGVSVGNLIFAIGGFDPEIKIAASVDLLNVTDSSEWALGPALPKPRAGAAADVVGSAIFLCGGFNVLNSSFDASLLMLQL